MKIFISVVKYTFGSVRLGQHRFHTLLERRFLLPNIARYENRFVLGYLGVGVVATISAPEWAGEARYSGKLSHFKVKFRVYLVERFATHCQTSVTAAMRLLIGLNSPVLTNRVKIVHKTMS